MSKLRFFKTVLVEIDSEEAMEIAYPIHHAEIDIKERIDKCPECDGNSYRLFDDTSCAVYHWEYNKKIQLLQLNIRLFLSATGFYYLIIFFKTKLL